MPLLNLVRIELDLGILSLRENHGEKAASNSDGTVRGCRSGSSILKLGVGKNE